MKLFPGVGGVLSVAFVALALDNLSSIAHFRNDVSVCIWPFASALGLIFGLYAAALRSRITALEDRLSERE